MLMRRSIAFVGYDLRHTCMNFTHFALDNEDQVAFFHRPHRIVLRDGTEIFAVTSPVALRGRVIDQIILADDSRRLILSKQAPLIARLLETQGRSGIPSEFAIQWYDLDAPSPV